MEVWSSAAPENPPLCPGEMQRLLENENDEEADAPSRAPGTTCLSVLQDQNDAKNSGPDPKPAANTKSRKNIDLSSGGMANVRTQARE